MYLLILFIRIRTASPKQTMSKEARLQVSKRQITGHFVMFTRLVKVWLVQQGWN